jgi:hypothetical protein
MDMHAVDVEIGDRRLDELIRWHGTDESDLPPAHTLQNLSRDTIAALHELQRLRRLVDELRTTMGRAFWAEDLRQLRTILLQGLGPPPPHAIISRDGQNSRA